MIGQSRRKWTRRFSFHRATQQNRKSQNELSLRRLEIVFCSGKCQLVQKLQQLDMAFHFEFSTGGVAEDSGKTEQHYVMDYQKSKNLFCRRLNKLEKMSIEKWEDNLTAEATQQNRRTRNELRLRCRGMGFLFWHPTAKFFQAIPDIRRKNVRCRVRGQSRRKSVTAKQELAKRNISKKKRRNHDESHIGN